MRLAERFQPPLRIPATDVGQALRQAFGSMSPGPRRHGHSGAQGRHNQVEVIVGQAQSMFAHLGPMVP